MGKQRIGYIDAMRGFTMLLVVYNHVLMCSFSGGSSFSFNDIFLTFRMPLFFLLSGFLMYKPERNRQWGDVRQFLQKKLVVQLVPTFIFTIAYCLILRHSFSALWFEKAKCGSWFTVTLFVYFVIYSVGDLVVSKFLQGRKKILLGSIGAVLVYAFSKYSLMGGCPWRDSSICGLLGFANWQYFLFFFMGALIKAFFNVFLKQIDRPLIRCLIVTGFIVIQFIIQLPQSRTWIIHTLSFPVFSFIKTIAGIFGVLTIFVFFRKHDSFWNCSRTGKALRYIGERTLDIYLIHLIIIQTNMRFIGEFLSSNSSPITELVVGGAVSLITIAVCLVISSVIRSSDVLAKLLFGKVIES